MSNSTQTNNASKVGTLANAVSRVNNAVSRTNNNTTPPNINNENNENNNENTIDSETNIDPENATVRNVSITGDNASKALSNSSMMTPNITTNTSTKANNNKGKNNGNGKTRKNTSLTNANPEGLTLKLNNNMSGTSETNTSMNTPSSRSNSEVTEVESQLTTNTRSSTTSEKRVSLNRLCMNLINHQVVMKLFHFQTEHYGAHKASDKYIEKYSGVFDRFLEVAQGIYGKISLKKYSLTGSSHTDENIVKHLDGMIIYWRSKIDDILDEYTDLINIRDELVGDAEQLKYLLTFK
jgi:hypothetical protein